MASWASANEPGEGCERTGGPGQGTPGGHRSQQCRAPFAGALKEQSWFRMKGDSPRESLRAEADPGYPPRRLRNAKASSTRLLWPPACPDHAVPSFLGAASEASTSPAPQVWGRLSLRPPLGGVCQRSWSNRKCGRCLPRANGLWQQLVGLRGRSDAESFN